MRVIDVLRWLYPGHWTYHRLSYGYGEWERDDGLLVKEQPSYSSGSGSLLSKLFPGRYEIEFPVHGPVNWMSSSFHRATIWYNVEDGSADGVCLPPYVEPLYHLELT